MKPGSIEHVDFEIRQTEAELFCLADRLREMHEATDVVLRAVPPNADHMLSVLRRHRALIRKEMDILAAGLGRYDAIRADAILAGLRR